VKPTRVLLFLSFMLDPRSNKCLKAKLSKKKNYVDEEKMGDSSNKSQY